MKKGFLLVHVLDLLKLRYEPNKIFYQDFLCRVKLYKKKSNLEKQNKKLY